MNAKERAIDAIEFFKAGQNVSAESVFNMLVEAIKEEIAPPSYEKQMFNFFEKGIAKEECVECVTEYLSTSEPGCLKPGCRRERTINSPPLIQGYTTEQWQEIIDGGYLVEVRDFDTTPWVPEMIACLDTEHDDERFVGLCEDKWKYCRPAQIKGVMRPIFVGPGRNEADVIFFDINSMPIGDGSSISVEGCSYVWGPWHEKVEQRGATKYIEV